MAFLLGLVGDQTDVMHFAKYGVVMVLFLVGLEFQPSRLWKLRHYIIGLGLSALELLGNSQESVKHPGELFAEHDRESIHELSEVYVTILIMVLPLNNV